MQTTMLAMSNQPAHRVYGMSAGFHPEAGIFLIVTLTWPLFLHMAGISRQQNPFSKCVREEGGLWRRGPLPSPVRLRRWPIARQDLGKGSARGNAGAAMLPRLHVQLCTRSFGHGAWMECNLHFARDRI